MWQADQPGQDRALPHSVPTAPDALAAAADEQELVASQPSSQEDPDNRARPADVQQPGAAEAGSSLRSAAPQPLLLPAPGSWPAAQHAGTGGVASAAAAGSSRPPTAPARLSGGAAASATTGHSATAEALRKQQRSARSLSLAEYFVKRRATVNPEDSFRIFCQVRGVCPCVCVRATLLLAPLWHSSWMLVRLVTTSSEVAQQHGKADASRSRFVAPSTLQHLYSICVWHPSSLLSALLQVLGLLAKCHARGIALRRVRPSQLRVTAAGAVFADTLPAPPAEIALYAAPEELGLTGPAQSGSAPAPLSPALAQQLTIPGSLAVAGGVVVSPPQTAVGAATLSAMAADMFSLGILFFELFHPIAGGAAERARTLGELRHRILPMDLLQVLTLPLYAPLHPPSPHCAGHQRWRPLSTCSLDY